jgi:hypothetical protein
VCVLCNQRPKNFFFFSLPDSYGLYTTSFRLRRKMNSRMEIKEGIGEQPYTVAGCSSSSGNYYQLYNERVRFVCTALVLHGNKLAAGRVSQPQKSRNAERKLKPKSTFWGLFWRSLSLCYTTRWYCGGRISILLRDSLLSPFSCITYLRPRCHLCLGRQNKKSFFSFSPLSRSGLIIDSFSSVYT